MREIFAYRFSCGAAGRFVFVLKTEPEDQSHVHRLHRYLESRAVRGPDDRHPNGGALTTMISVGHRTGLFDAMADGEARTSVELADHAALNERYVREWLGAMVTGGIVSVDSPPGSPPSRSRSCRTTS